MNENVTLVFHGFLNFPKPVEAVNEYFDSNDREPIRPAHENEYAKINLDAPAFVCQCRGK